MSRIDLEQVRRTARLARLAVSEEELLAYRSHFERLLALVEDVTEAPIEDVKPLAHPLDMTQRLRPDEVTEEECRESLQAGAPRVEDGYYLVPRVIE